MKLRQIALDTETTGIDAKTGHRIIEIGCVELIDRRITGEHFHTYLNPERDIDPQAQAVHGLSREFLFDKPVFSDIFSDFFDYINGAQLIIHNAAFDLGFINEEFKRLGKKLKPIEHCCSVVDTLLMARKMYPGQKNNLDALCKRLGVDNSHRQLHGALLDAQILASVYLALTSGQDSLFMDSGKEANTAEERLANLKINTSYQLPIIRPEVSELDAHQARLQQIKKKSGRCLWEQCDD